MTRKEILEKTIDFDDAINRIVRLEKESKLKTRQLTKAKEIINEFLSYYHSNNYPYQMLEILGKAEQFLKDNEVEK